MNKYLLDVLSIAFQVCVQGFKGPIVWSFKWDRKTNRIISRGAVRYPSKSRPLTDIRKLTPEQESCVGVPDTGQDSPKMRSN